MIAKCLSFLLLLGFPVFSGQSTYPTPGPGRNAYSAPSQSTYTYSQWAYAVTTFSSGAYPNVVSNGVTVSAGDFAFQFCRGYGSPTSIAGSSTPTATVNALPLTTWGPTGSYLESFWYPSLAAGSTTFTCTPSSAMAYQSETVVIYHHSGSAPAILSGSTTTGTCASGTTCTSSSFSTASAALVIDCASIGGGFFTLTAGTIGSNTATIRGVSQSSLTSSADSICEDTQFSTPQSSITASVNGSSAEVWGYTVAAFD